MKSYWIVTRDGESVMEARDMPVPQPAHDEVLIRVRASGFNRGELFVGGAVHGGAEKHGGTEASGIVEALGRDVTGIKVGDEVMGRARGAFGEFATLYQGQVLKRPPNLSWEQAAAIPSTFITAYEAMVRYGGLQAGEWVLVSGASAGVGVACVLTAKVLGAHTIGLSGSAAKLARLRELGMDAGIATRAPDFAEKVKQLTGGRGADLAVNLVGGTVFQEMLNALTRGGRLAIVGYVDGVHQAAIDLTAAHVNRQHIFGISNVRLTREERAETTRGFARDVLPHIAAGRITPLVDRVFGFDELPAARAYFDSGERIGKVVVSMGGA
jgi:NADPH:quinone reductase-like Zn-dependent oxidoreductase